MAVTRFPIGVPADVNLNDVRSRAKALLKSVQAGERGALERVKPYFGESSLLTLQRAQLVIARDHGFSSWHKLKAFVDARDELGDCQRKLAGMPVPQERTDFQPDSEWQRSAAELRRLTCVIAKMFDATVENTDTACCTFCFQPHSMAMGKLIAATANFICDQCVDRCASLMHESSGTNPHDARDYLPCSFCRKPATKVDDIVTASNSSICNECLEICRQIVAGDPPPRQARGS